MAKSATVIAEAGDRPEMRTGILGGAFDPPHAGHVALAREAITQLGLTRLIVLPTGQAPHKEIATPAETRFHLATIAFADVACAEVSRYELDRAQTNYTVDTLKALAERYGDLVFIVGADEFASFLQWRDPEGVLDQAMLAVGARDGYRRAELDTVYAELAARGYASRVVFLETPVVPGESSDLRARIGRGETIGDAVPEAVAAEIERLGLYR